MSAAREPKAPSEGRGSPDRAPALWGCGLAALVGAATVALAEPNAVGLEVLDLVGAGGPPWWRLRALWLGLFEVLPLGTLALRLGLAVALLHALLGALVAWLAVRDLQHRGSNMAAFAAPAGAFAAALTVTAPPLLDAVALPSAAALGPAVLLLAHGLPHEDRSLPLRALLFGLLLAVDPLLAPLLLLGPLLHWLTRADRSSAFPWRSLLTPALCGLSPMALWLTPSRALYTLPMRWPGRGAWEQPLTSTFTPGGALLLLVLLGALWSLGASIRQRLPLRELVRRELLLLEWLLLLALGLLFGAGLGSSALIALSAYTSLLLVRTLWWGGALLARRKVPFVKTTLALSLLMLCALPLARIDRRLAEPLARRVAFAAADLPLLSQLPEQALVLARDREGEHMLLRAQALGAAPASVTVLPMVDVHSHRAYEILRREPKLVPIVREILLDDLPSELTLTNLAYERALLIEVPPSVERTIAKHLVPQGLWTRFDPEPRAASDRASALDRDKRLRELAFAHLDRMPEVKPRTRRASRRLAMALAATGEKQSAERGISQLRAFDPDDPLVSLLLRTTLLGIGREQLEELVSEE